MNIRLSMTLLLAISLLSACGGGDDNTPDFISADANSSYTGQRTLAALNTANAPEYLSMLYGPGLETPSLSFRSTRGLNLVGADFLHEQQKMLQYIKQKIQPIQYSRRSVSRTESCENNGTVKLDGNVEDGDSKGKINLTYNNCRVGEFIFDGNAHFLIYATNGSFEEISSATISYNGLRATPINGGEAFDIVGTLDEVTDYSTGSTRLTLRLHRQTISTGKQTLIDVVRHYYEFDDGVRITGSEYHGLYGRANLSTLQPIIYNPAGIPLNGIVLLEGKANSKIQVTALGEQYSPELDKNLLLIRVEVDANGDGVYESNSQLSTDEL